MLAREGSASVARVDRTDPKTRFDHLPAVKVGAGAIGAQAVGAQAIGTLTLAAIAVGALAIGALAIGRLTIGRARIRRLEIDELVVRRLGVLEQLQSPPNHLQPHMVGILKDHKNDLAHHVRQAQAWLADSEQGERTACLSYAALELRFAVERLAVHYWATLLSRKPEEADLREIESFKRVERRIYELGGHQQEINAHFEFMRVILAAMKVDLPFHTPNIGVLSKYWHDCSKLCHVGWPLSCSVPAARKRAYDALVEAASTLEAQVKSLGWPTLKDQSFTSLRDRFVAGQATRDDVISWVREKGSWAQVELPGGQAPIPYGTPIAPAASGNEPEGSA